MAIEVETETVEATMDGEESFDSEEWEALRSEVDEADSGTVVVDTLVKLAAMAEQYQSQSKGE